MSEAYPWEIRLASTKRNTCLERLADTISFRTSILNDCFEWNEENRKKIVDLCSGIHELYKKLYIKMAQMKTEYDNLIQSGKSAFNYYTLSGSIIYTNMNPRPFTDRKTAISQVLLSHWDFVNMDMNYYQPLPTMDETLAEINLNHNWNIEQFSKENVDDAFIPYLVHVIFNDDDTYSKLDMLNLKLEDFKMHIDVDFEFTDFADELKKEN